MKYDLSLLICSFIYLTYLFNLTYLFIYLSAYKHYDSGVPRVWEKIQEKMVQVGRANGTIKKVRTHGIYCALLLSYGRLL